MQARDQGRRSIAKVCRSTEKWTWCKGGLCVFCRRRERQHGSREVGGYGGKALESFL